ncbi:hypothetical protein [Paenibacillus rhizoplanae]|uniref:hypothetical protein n=1 Tax=Paenibacillus rhizoplanae TaxID=1917181 RepID=UPI00361A92F5
MILLNNLQSYLLRNELGMSNVAPLVLILIFIFFFAAVVRMPLILSIIATISGFAIFAGIQTLLILLISAPFRMWVVRPTDIFCRWRLRQLCLVSLGFCTAEARASHSIWINSALR